MVIRCEASDCKYNRDKECRLREILIDENYECEDYEYEQPPEEPMLGETFF